MPYKIGPIVDELPVGPTRNRWKEVFDAVADLPAGKWLTVECADDREATCLLNAARTHRTIQLICRQRKNVAYLSKAPIA